MQQMIPALAVVAMTIIVVFEGPSVNQELPELLLLSHERIDLKITKVDLIVFYLATNAIFYPYYGDGSYIHMYTERHRCTYLVSEASSQRTVRH